MKAVGRFLAGLVLTVGVFSVLVFAQAPPAAQQPMSFFITSVPKGDGANYGGLAGADAHCQQLGAAAGRGAATLARLSQHAGTWRGQCARSYRHGALGQRGGARGCGQPRRAPRRHAPDGASGQQAEQGQLVD